MKRESKTSSFLRQTFDVSRDTRVAILAADEVIEDTEPANGCVRVMTLKGQRATLSHLNISHDPARFSRDLKSVAGSGARVILNGSENGSSLSSKLLGGIYHGLQGNGFVVADLLDESHNDVGGTYSRIAVLSQNGARVTRRDAKGTIDTVNLSFPTKK